MRARRIAESSLCSQSQSKKRASRRPYRDQPREETRVNPTTVTFVTTHEHFCTILRSDMGEPIGVTKPTQTATFTEWVLSRLKEYEKRRSKNLFSRDSDLKVPLHVPAANAEKRAPVSTR